MSLTEDEVILVLQKSRDDWLQFQSEYLKNHLRIEISQWIISDKDMSHYHFVNCDFRGAIISNVNFDYCTFTNCRILGCRLDLLSLVRVEAENIILEDVEMKTCTFRQASLMKSEFAKVTGNDLNIISTHIDNLNCIDCSIESSNLIEVKKRNIYLKDSKLKNLQCNDMLYHGIEIFDCDIEDSLFSKIEAENLHIHRGEITKCQIINMQVIESEISDTNFKELIIENGNFLNGRLVKIILKEIGIEKIGLMQTTLLNCEWPTQTYKISWRGKYIPSRYLLKQPVEDIIGITPRLRNEIQRAQLVDETHNECKSIFTKMWLWFWGMTTEYGRSLARLTALYAIIIIIMISLFIMYIPIEALNNSFWEYFRESCLYIFFNFIGVSTDFVAFTIGQEQNMLLVIDRIVGIVFIGLWTGIAANKIGSIN